MVSISADTEINMKIADASYRAVLETQKLIEQSRESLRQAWLTIVAAQHLVAESKSAVDN